MSPSANTTRQENTSEDDCYGDKASLSPSKVGSSLSRPSFFSQVAQKWRGATAVMSNPSLIFPLTGSPSGSMTIDDHERSCNWTKSPSKASAASYVPAVATDPRSLCLQPVQDVARAETTLHLDTGDYELDELVCFKPGRFTTLVQEPLPYVVGKAWKATRRVSGADALVSHWTHSGKGSVPPRESQEWKTAETPVLSQKKRGSSESCRTFMRGLTYATARENVGSGWVPLRPPQVGFLGYTDQPEDSPYGVIRSKFVSCAIGVVGR